MEWRSSGFRLDRPREAWKLFGIPIQIDRSWFIIVLFVTWSLSHRYFPSAYPGMPGPAYWLMGGTAALLLFACVLLHELGHSLAAKGYGIPVARITLFIFGGVAQISNEPRRPFVELVIALAGPMVSIVLAVVCFQLSGRMTVETYGQLGVFAIVRYLAVINTVILIFNLLPGLPLDGGRVLRAALWAITGSFRKATRIASMIGSGLGLCLMLLGVWSIIRGSWFGLFHVGIGFLLRDAARASYRQAAN